MFEQTKRFSWIQKQIKKWWQGPVSEKKFLNAKSDFGRKAYNKQRNLCAKLIRGEKNFFSNIITSDITDNKTFEDGKVVFSLKKKNKIWSNAIRKKFISLEGQEEIFSEKIFTENQAVVEVFKIFLSILFQTARYLVIMVMIMISLPLMTMAVNITIVDIIFWDFLILYQICLFTTNEKKCDYL